MRTLLFLALALGAIPASAQLSAGITAGGNLTFTALEANAPTVPGFALPEPIDLPGYHAGLFAEYAFGERVGVRLDALYTVRRFRFDERYDTLIVFEGLPLTGRVEVESLVRRQYLELPLSFVYRPAPHLSLRAGPALGLLLGNYVATSGEVAVGVFGFGINLPFSDINSATTGLRGNVAAFHAGMGYDTSWGLDLGMHWWHGLGRLEEDDNSTVRTRQHHLRVSVGWAFAQGRER
jgi:hypothetical protein